MAKKKRSTLVERHIPAEASLMRLFLKDLKYCVDQCGDAGHRHSYKEIMRHLETWEGIAV